jgi:hypothetical protein
LPLIRTVFFWCHSSERLTAALGRAEHAALPDAEHGRDLGIDGELNGGGLLDWYAARIGAVQNPSHEIAGAAIEVSPRRAAAEEAAGVGELRDA